MMYEELVKSLRNCSGFYCGDCKYKELLEPGNWVKCMNKLIDEAADAIEDLTARFNGAYAVGWAVGEEAAKSKMPQWIQVEERLPEIGEVVLAFGTRSATTGMFQGVGGAPWIWHWKGSLKRVSHWMPLPRPQKDGE